MSELPEPNPEQHGPPPLPGPPFILEYAGQNVPSSGWQGFLGFLAWIGTLVAMAFSFGLFGNNISSSNSPATPSQLFPVILILPALILVALVGVTIFIRVRYRWRAFLPGVLIGMGVTCLLPIGIWLVVCGFHG